MIAYNRLVAGVAALCGMVLAVAAEAQQPAPNRLSRDAQQAGLTQCAGRLDAIGRFLGVDRQSGLTLWRDQGAPDQQLASASMELPVSKGGTVYASATVAPNPINGCSFDYEAVVYHPAKCGKVASEDFPGARALGPLKTAITVLEIANGGRVFLLPAGAGCVAIKKEVVTR